MNVFPQKVLLFQLCFTRTILLSLFLKQPAGHCVPWGWGHCTCSGAAFGALLEPTCSVVHLEQCLPFRTGCAGSVTASVGICCLCTAAHYKGKNCCKSKKTCKTKGTASLPGTCSCRALPPLAAGGESHPAMLHSSLQPVAWVGVLCNPDTMKAFLCFWGASIQQIRHAGLGQVTVLTG